MKDSLGAVVVKIIVSIMLICVGGYLCFNSEYKASTGGYYSYSPKLDTESDSSYGGDAYTGIQNAGAQAATNAYYVYKRIDAFAVRALQMAGVVIAICGTEKLLVTICNHARKVK